jgi:hypothetical protein
MPAGGQHIRVEPQPAIRLGTASRQHRKWIPMNFARRVTSALFSARTALRLAGEMEHLR